MLVNPTQFFKFMKKIWAASLPVARALALTAAPLCLLLLPMDVDAASGIVGKLGNVALGGLTGLFQGLGEAAGTTIGWIAIIYALSSLFMKMTVGIFLWLINMLIGVSQYNQFLGAPIVTIGWAVTRDMANMFLVVALLVIAFATILNIHSYQASALLKNFVIAALLVNFSKMLCGLLIDASQVVMMTFVSGYSETAAGNFIKMFQVGSWLKLALSSPDEISVTTATELASNSSDLFSSISGNIFVFVISIVGIIALLSMLSVLVARILTLWFLIIVSPLAFVAKVLPFTAGYAGKWWSAMSQQLIAGPIVAFIIWVSLASVAVSDKALDLTMQSAQKDSLFGETAAAVSSNEISKWSNLALYFVPIVLFIMGAKWSVSMAGGLASTLSKATAGSVSGWARAGAGFVKKQALTGEFGIATQTKKGLTGEGGWVTRGLSAGAQTLGEKAEKLGERMGEGGRVAKGLAWAGRAAQKAQDATVGGRARARIRYGGKQGKSILTSMGIGEDAKKMKEIEAADEDAAYIERRASNDYMKATRQVEATQGQAGVQRTAAANFTAQANAARAAGNIPEANRLEREAAQSNAVAQRLDEDARVAQMKAINDKNSVVQIAKGKRKGKIDELKKKFEEKGLNQPDLIMNRLREAASGNEKMPQIEIDALKSAMDDALESEKKRKVDEARTAHGPGWTTQMQRDEEVRVDREHSVYKQAMTQALDTHRSENLEFATQAVQNQEKRFRGDQPLHADVLKVANEAQRTVGAIRVAGKQPHQWVPKDFDTVVDAVGSQLATIVNADGTFNTARQQDALREALRDIPVQQRTEVVNLLQVGDFEIRNSQGQVLGRGPIPAAVANPALYIPQPPNTVITEVQTRMSARPNRDNGPYPKRYNETDIGMVRHANGGFHMPAEAALNIETMVRTGAPAQVAQFIASVNPETIKHPEFGRAVGKGIQGPAILEAVRNQMRAMDPPRSREERVEYMRALKEHAMKNAESNEIRNAISQVALTEPEDIDPILRGDSLV